MVLSKYLSVSFDLRPSLPEGADELDNDPLVVEELLVDVDHAVHGVAAGDVVHVVAAAEVERHPAVVGGLLVNSEADGHAGAGLGQRAARRCII